MSVSTVLQWPGFPAIVRMCRAIVGAPDYAGYVQHLREHHPDITPLSEPEFQKERWDAKYSRPGSRCC
ncbi:MAG: YbdD/YjiX family protein [bacterium]|jgi:uncharacterized short protein YbdD (DUF466 family)|nr:DUF466 domain-containing protein [bacterium]